MIELGKKQVLTVCRTTDHGVYVGEKEEKGQAVLLPRKLVPEGTAVGDSLEVFIYRDLEDRLVATTQEPAVVFGHPAVMKVVSVSRIGAFLDWGLDKDLFLPFKEQTYKVKEGDECLAALYIDKSSRLCATMKVYDYLEEGSPYKTDDQVEGIVYEVNERLGAFVAVDCRYHGRIPAGETAKPLRCGDRVRARVARVREDGRLDLSVREKAYLQIEDDAEQIMKVIDEYAGVLPFTDKASPEVIKRELGISKNAFKRAVGHLLKEGRIAMGEKSIRKI